MKKENMKRLLIVCVLSFAGILPARALFGIKVPDVLGVSVTCEVCRKALSATDKADRRLVEAKRCAQHRDLLNKCKTCSNAWLTVFRTECDTCRDKRKAREAEEAKLRAEETAEEARRKAARVVCCEVCGKPLSDYDIDVNRSKRHPGCRDMKRCPTCNNAWIAFLEMECRGCIEKERAERKAKEEAERLEKERREKEARSALRRDKPFSVSCTNGTFFARGDARLRDVFDALHAHWLPYRLRRNDLGDERNGIRGGLQNDEETVRWMKQYEIPCDADCAYLLRNALPAESNAETNLYPVMVAMRQRNTVAVFYACARPPEAFPEETLDRLPQVIEASLDCSEEDYAGRLVKDLNPEALDIAAKMPSREELAGSLKTRATGLLREYWLEYKSKVRRQRMEERMKTVTSGYMATLERLKSRADEVARYASAVDFAAAFFRMVETASDDFDPKLFYRVAVQDDEASRLEVALGLQQFYKTIRQKKTFPPEDNAHFVFYADPDDYHIKPKNPQIARVHVLVKIGEQYDYCGDLHLVKWNKEWKVRDWSGNDGFAEEED